MKPGWMWNVGGDTLGTRKHIPQNHPLKKCRLGGDMLVPRRYISGPFLRETSDAFGRKSLG